MKKFRTKKAMWVQIATDLNRILKIVRTDVQVENRFKTVMKRKKQAIDNNQTTGASRINIPYEEELSKISALDDSIEPEVLRSSAGIVKVKPAEVISNMYDLPSTSRCSSPEKKRRKGNVKSIDNRKNKSIQETLLDIHHEKEEARERRHQEKMELLRELLKK